MTDIFEKEDFERCKKQRKNVLTVFYIVTGFYALGAIGLFVFLGIKFKRVNRYYHMFKDVDVGLKEEWTAEFLRFEENIEVKDGVDFKCLIFSEWSEKKQEFFERKVLFDAEKEFPPITAGMKVRFVTQANIMLSYEIQ